LVLVKRVAIALLVCLAVAQFVRPSRTNRPVSPALEINAVQSVPSDLQSIFARSCYDCHSNRTVWPWYSHVAPVSWLLTYDVNEGRREMNLSRWGTYDKSKRNKLLGETCKEVSDGEMPGMFYTLMNPAARLTKADVQTICGWTQSSEQGLAAEKPRNRRSPFALGQLDPAE